MPSNRNQGPTRSCDGVDLVTDAKCPGISTEAALDASAAIFDEPKVCV